ncbi:hypothetical protein B0H14DRAFT_2622307 [Mycena olivaceomarginata]|nr:hypothetical protein B0H14DRAFT_2622307 [Mycena olivaceomarginata]
MAKLFVKKYGRDLADDQDFAVEVADPPDSVANEVVHEVLSEEEKGFRAAHHKALRTRIKAHVDALLAALKRRTENSGEGMPETINVISNVTNDLWEDESPEFRHKVETRVPTNSTRLGGNRWQIARHDPQRRLPPYYLQPFVDAIQQWFGMVATVLLCGPVGMRGGRIGMQSVHTGATLGVAPVDWPTSDWQGFQDVETSMVGFTTDAECRARALPGTAALLQPAPPLREEVGDNKRSQMTSQAGDSEGHPRPVPIMMTAPSMQSQTVSQVEMSTGEQEAHNECQREQDERRREDAAEERCCMEVEEERGRLQVYDNEWQCRVDQRARAGHMSHSRPAGPGGHSGLWRRGFECTQCGKAQTDVQASLYMREDPHEVNFEMNDTRKEDAQRSQIAGLGEMLK